MQYTNTITISSNMDGAKFTMLLLVLLLSIALYCLINIICDHFRLKKIELAIYLIEKGHNRKVAKLSGATSITKHEEIKGDETNGKRYGERKQNYYTSV